MAHPGEVSLAHHGVLFLDEISLYAGSILDSLRTPLEEGLVRIARAGGVITYPCRFSLVGAMNPCPCGYLGDSKRRCKCPEHRLEQYQAKLSGPLLDRFDLQSTMERSTRKQLMSAPEGETSAVVCERVTAARDIQRERYGSPMVTNASASKRLFDGGLNLTTAGRADLGAAIDHLDLSGRGVDRVLRVARTIADLDQMECVEAVHIARALQSRTGISGTGAAA
jgi:magnesium chelatase family protein